MKQNSLPNAAFVQTIRVALSHVKRELQRDYERAYPALREIIHLVLDAEEKKAWKLSPFPHLIFPDLVETHITALSLQPVEKHPNIGTERRERTEFTMFQPAFA